MSCLWSWTYFTIMDIFDGFGPDTIVEWNSIWGDGLRSWWDDWPVLEWNGETMDLAKTQISRWERRFSFQWVVYDRGRISRSWRYLTDLDRKEKSPGLDLFDLSTMVDIFDGFESWSWSGNRPVPWARLKFEDEKEDYPFNDSCLWSYTYFTIVEIFDGFGPDTIVEWSRSEEMDYNRDETIDLCYTLFSHLQPTTKIVNESYDHNQVVRCYYLEWNEETMDLAQTQIRKW